MVKLIDLLEKCANTYTNIGEYYKANASECSEIEEEIGQQLFESYPIEITDQIYDNLVEIAKSLYPSNPFFNKVGSPVTERTMGKVKLPFVMGSMVESHKGDLKDWLKPNTVYTLSQKLDGISCGLVYRNGQLVEAYTRGDGNEGQLITETVKRFGNQLPKAINYDGEIRIRGEIIIKKNDEETILKELKEETGKAYKNLRNLTAGCLNAKVAPKAFVNYANFVAYFIDESFPTEESMFEKLTELGFDTPYFMTLNSDGFDEDIVEGWNKLAKNQYKYEIDGMIITQDSLTDDVKGFETGTINPKRSRKYKAGCVDNYGITKITNIKWQLSSYGFFKPVIEFEPVELDGSTVTYATGNNYMNVLKNHLCIGAEIRVHKAGLVIPFIDETISYPDEQDYNLPNDCETYDNGVDLIYEEGTNESYDSEMALQKLVYFCNKLGVEFAGEGNIKRLMEYTELYNMSAKNLLLLPLNVFQQSIGVNGIKLYGSLHTKVKSSTISQFMDAVSAFGRGIGELKLNKIVERYNDLPYDYDKIIDVDGWSDITTQQYMDKYVHYINWSSFLQENGIQLKASNVEKDNNDYENLVVVFTGIRDKALEENIKKGSGKIVSSCTKACNLVIAKDVNENSTKLKKAREQGAEIISYEEALKRFNK